MRPKHTGKWTCTNCKKEFKWKQSLYNHKQSCEKGKIPCLNCNKTFSRASYAKVHKCKGKSGNETTCIICKKVFNKMWHLKRHVEAVHKDNGKSSYKCDNCGMVYQRENHYRKHIEKCKSLKKTKTTRQRKAKVSEAGDPDISFPEDSFIPSMLYFVDNNKNEYDERQTVDFNATSSYQENEEEPTVFVLDDFDSFSYECREIHDASIINGEHATPVGSQAFLNKVREINEYKHKVESLVLY